ncbi:hypothetical protein DSECCO2_316160 [anaerobic digester metagenome]
MESYPVARLVSALTAACCIDGEYLLVVPDAVDGVGAHEGAIDDLMRGSGVSFHDDIFRSQEVDALGVFQEVGLAHEGGGIRGVWMMIDLFRGADLSDFAFFHQDNPIGQGQGLFLIVGDKEHGDVQLALEFFQLFPHANAQSGVQIGQGFIQEQQLRLNDHGACQGYALLLAAAQFLNGLGFVSLESYNLEVLIGPGECFLF